MGFLCFHPLSTSCERYCKGRSRRVEWEELLCVKQNSARHSEIGFKLLTGDKVKAFEKKIEGEKIP